MRRASEASAEYNERQHTNVLDGTDNYKTTDLEAFCLFTQRFPRKKSRAGKVHFVFIFFFIGFSRKVISNGH